jgi:hypothetical protein
VRGILLVRPVWMAANMKLTTLALGIVLLIAHGVGDLSDRLSLPLSVLRDGPAAALGYIIFVLLLVIAGLMITAAIRAGRGGQACLFSLAGFLLFLVSVTPSEDAFHIFCAFVLLAVLYSYYAAVLHWMGTSLFWVHLAVPILLVVFANLHSYGLWQKCLISYFVIAINIHHHLLPRIDVGRSRGLPWGRAAGSWQPRRRAVWVLEPSKTWTREKSS